MAPNTTAKILGNVWRNLLQEREELLTTLNDLMSVVIVHLNTTNKGIPFLSFCCHDIMSREDDSSHRHWQWSVCQ